MIHSVFIWIIIIFSAVNQLLLVDFFGIDLDFVSASEAKILAIQKLKGRFGTDASVCKMFTWWFMTVLLSLHLNVMMHSHISVKKV